MHILKKIELNGFKSFADKTVVELPPGITAIVGPNGSGKSNIVDAIRWLLGEREARNLRGARAEDLIFAGTPKRPRVGQARASLHIDNTNGMFPIDFEEVEIMRKVQRDGNNSYFLNKAEVRLKDLVDFFAGARLGSRGVTVITQGNSDMFIEATPSHRREMIEEVLGLKEYRNKRDEAARKLHRANDNIDQLEARIQEIRPRLRSLRKQKEKWSRRSEIANQLKEAERLFFGSRMASLNNARKQAEKDIRSHQEKYRILQSKKEEAEQALAEIEKRQPQEKAARKELKKKIQSLMSEQVEIQKQIARLEMEQEFRMRQSQKQSANPSQLRAVLQKIKDLLAAGLKEGSLHGAAEEALLLIKKVQTESEAPTSQNISNSPPLARTREELKKIESNIKEIQEQEQNLESTQDSFYADFKRASVRAQEVQQRINEWEKAKQKKELALERVKLQEEELVRQIAQADRDLRDFRPSEQPLSEEELSSKQRELRRLRGELAAIGEIDSATIEEADEVEERYGFFENELEDITKARDDLYALINEIDDRIVEEFNSAIKSINNEFQKFFDLMFGGGKASMVVTNPTADTSSEQDEDSESQAPSKKSQGGVELKVSLPRKKTSSLEVLSGGERSLVGIAALFSLVSVSSPPFLVLDEVDAALDDQNSKRFANMLKEFSEETQFIIVTHNRVTMEAAAALYGVTLNEDGTSKVVSMKLESNNEQRIKNNESQEDGIMNNE